MGVQGALSSSRNPRDYLWYGSYIVGKPGGLMQLRGHGHSPGKWLRHVHGGAASWIQCSRIMKMHKTEKGRVSPLFSRRSCTALIHLKQVISKALSHLSTSHSAFGHRQIPRTSTKPCRIIDRLLPIILAVSLQLTTRLRQFRSDGDARGSVHGQSPLITLELCTRKGRRGISGKGS
jgi:hypothetical protein